MNDWNIAGWSEEVGFAKFETPKGEGWWEYNKDGTRTWHDDKKKEIPMGTPDMWPSETPAAESSWGLGDLTSSVKSAFDLFGDTETAKAATKVAVKAAAPANLPTKESSIWDIFTIPLTAAQAALASPEAKASAAKAAELAAPAVQAAAPAFTPIIQDTAKIAAQAAAPELAKAVAPEIGKGLWERIPLAAKVLGAATLGVVAVRGLVQLAGKR